MRAVFNLVPRYFQRLFVIAFFDKRCKSARTCHVCPFADVHKQRIGGDVKRLQTAQSTRALLRHRLARWMLTGNFDDSFNMFRLRSTTSSDDVEESVLCEVVDCVAHFGRRLRIVSQLIRQSRVRIADNRNVGEFRHLGEIRTNLRRTESAI